LFESAIFKILHVTTQGSLLKKWVFLPTGSDIGGSTFCRLEHLYHVSDLSLDGRALLFSEQAPFSLGNIPQESLKSGKKLYYIVEMTDKRSYTIKYTRISIDCIITPKLY
jgi:hypothetical protein